MRPERESDHSPPPSAEVKKNMDLYIHSPWDNFTFYFAMSSLYFLFMEARVLCFQLYFHD
jgi:hypothetical protein